MADSFHSGVADFWSRHHWFCTVCSELGAGRTISRLPSRGCRRIPGAALLVPSCRRTVLYCLATPLSGVGVVAAPPCEGANPRGDGHRDLCSDRPIIHLVTVFNRGKPRASIFCYDNPPMGDGYWLLRRNRRAPLATIRSAVFNSFWLARSWCSRTERICNYLRNRLARLCRLTTYFGHRSGHNRGLYSDQIRTRHLTVLEA